MIGIVADCCVIVVEYSHGLVEADTMLREVCLCLVVFPIETNGFHVGRNYHAFAVPPETPRSARSELVISAASFQETTRVLTEAAIAGRVD